MTSWMGLHTKGPLGSSSWPGRPAVLPGLLYATMASSELLRYRARGFDARPRMKSSPTCPGRGSTTNASNSELQGSACSRRATSLRTRSVDTKKHTQLVTAFQVRDGMQGDRGQDAGHEGKALRASWKSKKRHQRRQSHAIVSVFVTGCWLRIVSLLRTPNTAGLV